MQKKISTIWRFLIPVLLLLAIAPFVLTGQQASQQLGHIYAGATAQAQTLVRFLDITEELVGEQANAAMRLLKSRSQELGYAHIDGNIQLASKSLPNLKMGLSGSVGRRTAMAMPMSGFFIKCGGDRDSQAILPRIASTWRGTIERALNPMCPILNRQPEMRQKFR